MLTQRLSCTAFWTPPDIGVVHRAKHGSHLMCDSTILNVLLQIWSRRSQRISMAGKSDVCDGPDHSVAHLFQALKRLTLSKRSFAHVAASCQARTGVCRQAHILQVPEMSSHAFTVWQMLCRCQAGHWCSSSPAAATAVGPEEQAE